MKLKFPVGLNVALLVVVTTLFYTYVGQIVPQAEVLPPEEFELSSDLTVEDMVLVGEKIAGGKGLCLTCHTIGQSGALRFPDLAGIGARAGQTVPGMNDVEYLAQSLYEPDVFVVEGYNPGMPTIHRPPIGLTEEEILCVIAWLQSMGGTPTVSLETTHAYSEGGG